MRDLSRQVERCNRLLGDHLAAAVQTFGSTALALVDLPPLAAPGQIAPPQLRAAATLFWCAQVEGAGLLAVVDALAEAAWTGTSALPLGAAGDRLMRHHRGRDDRFAADERKAIYQRLFGDDTGFLGQWNRLVGGLVDIGRAPLDRGLGDLIAQVQAAALELAHDLGDRATGITGFAGRDIVEQVWLALDLLSDPELARALGGGGPWQIVRRTSPWLLGRAVEPAAHLERAKAGLTMLEWIAARTSALEGSTLIIGRDDPVVRAALRWQASAPRGPRGAMA